MKNLSTNELKSKALANSASAWRAATLFALTLIGLFLGVTEVSAAVRLKDLAAVQGVRHNQLVGYGIVVGLNGTGDGRNAVFTTGGLANTLRNMGINNVSPRDIRVRNVAGVIVTAHLPPFARAGQKIDVTVSSVGDASSLQGGTLLLTPLRGLDNQVYAIAQGPVSIGGFEVPGPAARDRQQNHLTVARIPAGASIEREVPVSFVNQEEIVITLNSPDFTTVKRMTQVINGFLGGGSARAQDGATVIVKVPENYRNNEIFLLAAIENLEIIPDRSAKVVVDERTGTVVMGQNVQLREAAVAHGYLTLQITPPPLPDEMLGAIEATPQRLVRLESGITLNEVVRALNSVGVAPRDLIAILQALRVAGSLKAELEII